MSRLNLPAIDPAEVTELSTTIYPEPFKSRVAGRKRRRLGDAGGLKNFGVNLVRLGSGSESSMRHWHSKQDEFIYVLEGEVTLVTDAGRQKLRAGMAAGFPASSGDAHQLVNESDQQVLYLEVGDRSAGDAVTYTDVDMALKMVDGKAVITRKDGSAI